KIKKRLEAERWLIQADRLRRNHQLPEAIAALRRAILSDPDYAKALNNLAWALLVNPPTTREPKEALSLALNAVERAPDNLGFQNTVGLALYRNGRFAEAVSVLTASLREPTGPIDAYSLFILAMCHHRLGNITRAREYHDRAGQWLDEYRADLTPIRLDE